MADKMYAKKSAASSMEIKPTRARRIFVSFVEEYWPGQIEGTTMGRIEVEHPGDHYPSEEIRWGCWATDEFRAFRNTWDFRYISKKELSKVRNKIEGKFAPVLFNAKCQG